MVDTSCIYILCACNFANSLHLTMSSLVDWRITEVLFLTLSCVAGDNILWSIYGSGGHIATQVPLMKALMARGHRVHTLRYRNSSGYIGDKISSLKDHNFSGKSLIKNHPHFFLLAYFILQNLAHMGCFIKEPWSKSCGHCYTLTGFSVQTHVQVSECLRTVLHDETRIIFRSNLVKERALCTMSLKTDRIYFWEHTRSLSFKPSFWLLTVTCCYQMPP